MAKLQVVAARFKDRKIAIMLFLNNMGFQNQMELSKFKYVPPKEKYSVI